MTARNHHEMQKVALIICQVNGCEARHGLARHHIIERSITQCDEPENLVVLCEEHHRRVHDNEVDLGTYLTASQGAKAVLLMGSVYRAFMHLYPSESPKRVARAA